MTKTRRLLAGRLSIAAILFIIIPCLVWAADFGLILNQRAGFAGITDGDNHFDYTGILLPRFSALVGNGGEIFISAGFTANREREEWTFVPELLRTEFHWIFGLGDFRIGRMHYSDPLGFIVAGLFDGARITFDTPAGRFSAGAWYTGFLYKKRANIAMTIYEQRHRDAPIDFDNFADTYFAPSRVLVALDWVHPGLARGFLRTSVSFIGQFDLTGEYLHSQYLAAKFAVPAGSLTFAFGGSLGLAYVERYHQIFFAAEAGITWTLPTPLPSWLSLMGRYTSGVSSVFDDRYISAFLPVTTISQSPILQPRASGLFKLFFDYSIRFNRNFAMSLSSFYFVRNDLHTNGNYVTIAGEYGHLVGAEFFSRLFWIPASDVHLNLGAGIFLPSLGNVAPNLGNIWRVELGLAVSLF